MNKVVNNIYYLCLLFSYFKCLQFYQIGGKCGFPGLPHETKLDPHKSVYEEGEEVRYSCPFDRVYLKTQIKKCVSGEWVGPRSTCGYFIRNQLTSVRVIDLSNNETVIDKNTSNYTEEYFPVSFYDERANDLLVPEPHRPHQWWFQFSNPIKFDFFLLNLRIPRSKFNSKIVNQIDLIRVKDVQVINEDNRTCALDYTNRTKWAKIFWFWCTESKERVLNKPLAITFTTYANQKMESIGLHQVYLTKLQFCGEPPVPLFAKYVPHDEETGQIQCDDELSVNVSHPLVLSAGVDQSYDCIDNEYWSGRPKCWPKSYCELNFDNSTEEISSVKSAYILSKTEWLAIEGTTVYFKCKEGYELLTESMRECLHNSTWNMITPICGKITNKQQSNDTFV